MSTAYDLPMPLYDFRCERCDEHYEANALVSGSVPCPRCGSEEVRRVFSAFAGPYTVRPRGLAARRADATRAVKEEQRLERKEQRRAQREQG